MSSKREDLDSLYWEPKSDKGIPEGAVYVGMDSDGGRIYVCRASHKGELIPGHFSDKKQEAIVTWNGAVLRIKDYEVLVASRVAWMHQKGTSDIPLQAVKGGNTYEGLSLYIGRCLNKCGLIPGKVHPNHGCLYIPSDGNELAVKEFEILVAF